MIANQGNFGWGEGTLTLENELLDLIDSINSNDNIVGLIVKLPLPKHMDTSKVTWHRRITFIQKSSGMSIIFQRIIPINKRFFNCLRKKTDNELSI